MRWMLPAEIQRCGWLCSLAIPLAKLFALAQTSVAEAMRPLEPQTRFVREMSRKDAQSTMPPGATVVEQLHSQWFDAQSPRLQVGS